MTGYRTDIRDLDASQWHDVVALFADARIEQTRTYAKVRASQARLRHLVIYDGDDIVAAVQIVARPIPLLRRSISFVKYGPLWQRHGETPDVAHLHAALAALHACVVDAEGGMLRTMPAADPAKPDLAGDALVTLGYVHGPLADSGRYLVDLSLNDVAQRASLKGKWRYNLKRAEAGNLTVHCDDEPNALHRFGALHREMSQRKSFDEPFDIGALPGLTDLPETLRPRVLVCLEGETPVAAAVIDTAGAVAQYLWGATSRRGAKLDAGYVLHWQASAWLRRHGHRWYDLGGDCGDPGLRQFKSGLIGKAGRIVQLPGNYDAAGSVGARLAGRIAFWLRDRRAG